MTYGHFINVKALITPDLLSRTIVHFDEFHEELDEKLIAYELLKPFLHLTKILFLSATPNAVDYAKTNHFKAPIPQRFKKKLFIRNQKVLDNYLWAQKQFPDHAKPENTIIRVVSYNDVEQVRQGLSERNIKTQEISARFPDKPKDDCLLVCTQVIDAGINLPKRRCLIENGMQTKQIRGQLLTEPSDPATSEQILGRVGRFSEDIVIRPSYSGTGRKPDPYSSLPLFTHEIVSKQHKVHRLHNEQISGCTTLPHPYNFIHIKQQGSSDNFNLHLFLLLLTEYQNYENISQSYNFIINTLRENKPIHKIPENYRFIIKFAQQTLQHDFEPSLLYDDIINLRNETNRIFYSLKYNMNYPLPIATRINHLTFNTHADNFLSLANGEIFYIYVHQLYILEGQYLNKPLITSTPHYNPLSISINDIIVKHFIDRPNETISDLMTEPITRLKYIESINNYYCQNINMMKDDKLIYNLTNNHVQLSSHMCLICKNTSPHSHEYNPIPDLKDENLTNDDLDYIQFCDDFLKQRSIVPKIDDKDSQDNFIQYIDSINRPLKITYHYNPDNTNYPKKSFRQYLQQQGLHPCF